MGLRFYWKIMNKQINKESKNDNIFKAYAHLVGSLLAQHLKEIFLNGYMISWFVVVTYTVLSNWRCYIFPVNSTQRKCFKTELLTIKKLDGNDDFTGPCRIILFPSLHGKVRGQDQLLAGFIVFVHGHDFCSFFLGIFWAPVKLH